MTHSLTIGIDAAKRIFFLHGESTVGKVVLRQKLMREQLIPYRANQPLCMIAIEAGCGAHHWARAFSKLGHEVRLISPALIKARSDCCHSLAISQ